MRNVWAGLSRMSARTVVAVILICQSLLLIWSAKVHSPTWDEVGHLAAGLSHWELRRFDLYSVNPPLVRTIAAAPVYLFDKPEMDWAYYRSDPKVRSEVYLGHRMMQLNGDKSLKHFFIARLAVIPIALLGTCLCFLWGRALFGVASGLMAACLWAFSPWVLGYGALITPDLATAVSVLAVSYCVWLWLKQPNTVHTVGMCAAFAVAMLTKSTWLILPLVVLPIWGIYTFVGAMRKKERTTSLSAASQVPLVVYRRWAQFAQLACAAAVALLVVNSFYGFHGSLKPLGEYGFASRMLSGNVECETCDGGGEVPVGNRFQGTMLAGLAVPLPSNYMEGIDIQRRDFERGSSDLGWQSYMFGTWQAGGWWYFYLVGLFVKTPLVLWLLFALASVMALRTRFSPEQRWGLVVLCVPALLLLVVLSMNTGLNRYVRYALPVIPVVSIWASQIVSWSTSQRKWPGWVGGVACFSLIVLSLTNAPHWLSFFNSTVGASNGHLVLTDSNVDWGQDFIYLKNWLKKHPEAGKDLKMAAFSSYDPACLGIEYKLPAPLNPESTNYDARLREGPRPGWYVISKNYLMGHLMPLPDGQQSMRFAFYDFPAFTYFQMFEPVDRIGESMLVYHLELPEVNLVRSRLGLPSLLDKGSKLVSK